MKKPKTTYTITAWTITPCPYLTDKIRAMNCEKMCRVSSPMSENKEGKIGPCVFRVIHKTKSLIMFRLMVAWYSIWYDYLDTNTEPESKGDVDG